MCHWSTSAAVYAELSCDHGDTPISMITNHRLTARLTAPHLRWPFLSGRSVSPEQNSGPSVYIYCLVVWHVWRVLFLTGTGCSAIFQRNHLYLSQYKSSIQYRAPDKKKSQSKDHLDASGGQLPARHVV